MQIHILPVLIHGLYACAYSLKTDSSLFVERGVGRCKTFQVERGDVELKNLSGRTKALREVT
jgi:hypothetical protein